MKRILRVFGLVLVVALGSAACDGRVHRRGSGPRRSGATNMREVWRWDAPPPAYVGMPVKSEEDPAESRKFT